MNINEFVQQVISIVGNSFSKIESSSMESLEYRDDDKYIEINIDADGIVRIDYNSDDCDTYGTVSFHFLELDDKNRNELPKLLCNAWYSKLENAREKSVEDIKNF